MKTKTPKRQRFNLNNAVDLFHEGMKVFSDIEHNGIKINVDLLKRTKRKVSKDIIKRTDKLRKTKVYKKWRNKFGMKANLGSKPQLGEVFYGVLGYKSGARTKTGKYKANEEELSKIDDPFIREYFQLEKLKKAVGTYLKGFERELTEDGFIYPNFNQHLAISFRTSSDNPNFQNIPIRNPEIGPMIRRLFISRFKKGHIVERDYSALEVAIALVYHQDPVMRKYLEDDFDFHRDTAAQIFMCNVEDVEKKTLRFHVKNKFTFAEFYGDYYKSITPKLWDAVMADNILIKGVPVAEHLRRKGIKRRGDCITNESPKAGTFEHQVQKIENDFWNNRFKVYTAWKKRMWEEYKLTGKIVYRNGFIAEGNFKRNQVINLGTQGLATHCLTWSLTEMQKEIRKMKMKTVLIGAIHDSALADCPHDELQDFLQMSDEIVVTKLRKHYPFIDVPLKTEVDVTPIGGSWHDKESWYATKSGKWKPVPPKAS